MDRKHAFTLVELLVCVGIVTALTGIVVPTVSRAIQSSKATVCQSNLRQIGLGVVMFANEHHQRLPYVLEPIWQTNGQLNFDADPAVEPCSLQNVLRPFVTDLKVYQCPESRLSYPRENPKMGYRVSSANNFDGQSKTIDQLMTAVGPKYEYSLKYLNGRPFQQLYVESAAYPFELKRGVGPFYVLRDFVSQTGSGEFAPPHPVKRYNQLMLDMSVTSERDSRYAYTYP